MEHLIESRSDSEIHKLFGDGLKFICDGCNLELCLNKNIFYHNVEHRIDLCSDCILNVDIHNNNVEIIDRINNTTDEKPLIWPCKCCKRLLGGGNIWSLYYNFIDICDSCDITDIITKQFNFIDKNKNYYYNEREHLVDLNSIEKHKFEVPDEVLQNITPTRNDEFIDILDSLVNEYIFDDILKWTLITDFTDVSYKECTGACVSIAIKCEYPYPIASVCIDNHGRCKIDIIHKSYDEYKKDYDNWKKNFTYSEFIRYKNELEIYFG